LQIPYRIGKYLVKKFILPFIIISCLVVFLYIIQDFIFNVNKYMKMDLKSLLLYFLYWIPYIYFQMFGVAILISTVYVISSLNISSELLAIHTSGVSTFSMAIILIIFIFFLSIFIIFNQDRFVIDNYKKKIEIENRFFPKTHVKDNFNITLTGSSGNIYYIGKYIDLAKEIYDIRIIKYLKNSGIKTEIIAESAKYISNGNWQIINANEYKYDLNKQEVRLYKYDQKIYKLGDGPELFQKASFDMELLHIKEGWQTINLMRKYNIVNYMDEFNFWAKFVFPISGFLISLFGIAAGSFFRKNILIMGLIVSIIIYGSYYFLINTLWVLGKRGIGDAFVSAILGPIIFLILGILALIKADKVF